MDILNGLNDLTLEQRELLEALLKKQGVDIAEYIGIQNKYSPIQSAENKEYYAMSSAQKRLYVLSNMEGADISYNMPGCLEVKGHIDAERFQNVFNRLIQRHEALRTSFEVVKGEPVQKVHNDATLNVENIYISEDRLADILKEFVQPFELDKVPLMRVKIISIDDEKHILAFDMHHIISDGITMSIIINEICRLYRGEELNPLRLQYKDFAEWQNNQIETGKLKNQEEYWLNIFNGKVPVLNMPADYSRPTVQSFEGDSLVVPVDSQLTGRLNALALKTGSTLYIILLAAYNILLSKYTGQEDIIVGSPIAGRSHADMENIVGVFINTLAMRNYPVAEKTFEDFVIEVKENSLKAFENQDYQFELLVEKLNIKRELSRNPLFDTVFVMQNTGSKKIDIEGLTFTRFEFESNVSKFDLTLNIEEIDDWLSFDAEYSTKLFKKKTIERLIGHYINILNIITENPEIKIADIDMLSESEERQILFEFNNPKAAYPADKTIHQLFEEQAERHPDNTAVVFGDKCLTYGQLNVMANNLARKLRDIGVKSENIVGIKVERSFEMIIGILGILKAGGAYLPIDPNYPEDRINFMLEDSKAAVLLVDKNHRKVNNEEAIQVIDLSSKYIFEGDGSNLENVNAPSNLAYIIYTSGTTGKPKGSMIEHRNVVRLLFNDSFQFDFNAGDVWTLFHSMSFDFSVWEMYGALLYGGKLVVVSKLTAREPSEFLKLLIKEKVTVLNQTPTAFSNLVREAIKNDETELNIRYVVFGGEALKPAILKSWKMKYPKTRLINMYGITETTVHVTYKEIMEKEINSNISNIGRPIPTLTAYIMDKNLKLMPIGVPGEICVGGEGVCRGYLDRPELNREKFVENPYVPGERLYRSGDLASFLSNGEMQYLGRIDHQVKIRGHRIELGEIENHLLKHSAVKEAVVLAKENTDGVKYLCAYLVENREITVNEIRQCLLKELPEYMIPAYFVKLDTVPLTSNGKVDRKALPDPDGSIDTGEEYMAAENEIEGKLVQIWQEALKVDRVGVNDNFFSIGGDSIKAISLLNAMNQVMKSNLQIKDIYMNQTIRSLAASLKDSLNTQTLDELENGLKLLDNIQKDILGDEKQALMLPSDWEDFYPLSQIQNSMVFYSKLRPDEPIYHDQFIFNVKFKLFDVDIFRKTIKLLMEKHQILRTVFDIEHFNIPIQVVRKDVLPELFIEDISSLSSAEQVVAIEKYLKKDSDNKFRFDNALLWRMGIFKVDYENYYIVLSFQHAILDGWSVSAFSKEFIEIFSRLIKAESFEAARLRRSYKDYVAISLVRKTSEKNREYWKNILSGYTRNKLPFNISGKKLNGMLGSKIYRKELGKELLEKLDKHAKEYKCSVRDICLSAHLYLLKIISSEKDIVTGLVTHDRPVIEDAQNILGCFLNTVPIRLVLEEKVKKSELLNAVKTYLKNLKEHELFLSDIAVISGSGSSSGNPIFDTLFNFTDFHILKEVQEEDSLKESDYNLQVESNEMTNTLFDLEVSKTMDNLQMQIKYAPGYFYEEDIKKAFELYISILEQFVNENVEVFDVEELLSSQEKSKVLYEFNNTNTEYEKNKTMHQLFEEQVEKAPDNIALKFEAETMTYRKLNEKSNQLARMLLDSGVKSGDNVGLITQRNFGMIIGMLAILKAGAAYVPIDPDYPQERLKYIASNSKVSALLVEKGYAIENRREEKVIDIDYDKMTLFHSDNLNIDKDSRELAYIIYTSGSTGLPKGVMIEHHSAINLISWVNREFEVGEKDTLLFITSMCFDLSVYDIFGMLAAGGKIVIAGKGKVQNPEDLKDILVKENITFWDSVPSTMNYLVNSLEESSDEFIQDSLRLVFMSGDWIPVKLPDKIRRYFPGARLISLGGATEGTVWSIYYPIEKVSEYQTSIPYGRPIDNNYFYILDDNGRVLPEGVAGELYIGGVGVARGYMGNDEKTAASFVKDRFCNDAEAMMYKTGDLGRMLPDGNIEFLGRKDHQVKIRGYRVELGEIENQLQGHEFITDAVVADWADAGGNKYLCAYIVSEQELTIQELKDYLSRKLPDYMIPSYFMNLDKLPFTSNGKIDRKSLPEPHVNMGTGTEYETPSTDIEKKLVKIWEEVLEAEKVGVNDSFFDLGGHSLIATTLVSNIHKELNFEIPLREIFNTPTVKEIAQYIENAQSSIYSPIEPVESRGYYALSYAQRRLYLLSQKSGASVSYNTPDAIEIQGVVDKEKFSETFSKLIERHEALRTYFEIADGEPVQRILDRVEFSVEYSEAEEDDIPGIINKFVRPFDLEKAPLLRVKLISIGNDRHILAYDMHHIISDGVSMKILVEEFARIYNGNDLDPLKIQYKDFSEWQNKRMSSEKIKSQETYWMKVFEGEIPLLDLPTDFPRPEEQSFEGDSITLTADRELTEKINAVALETGSTLYMVLLCAYNILISKYTGQEDIIVGSPTSGRTHADIEKVIGMFVNTLALRNRPEGRKTINQFIKEVKENSLKAFENQEYQFEELVERLGIKRDISRNPLFDVMFVLQNVSNGNEVNISDFKIKPYVMEKAISKFDITLEVTELNKEMVMRFEYCTRLFNRKTVERMSKDYLSIIRQIVENQHMQICDITLKNMYKQQESVISEDIEFNF